MKKETFIGMTMMLMALAGMTACSEEDNPVTPSNTTLLYQFLTEQGVENIELDEGKYGSMFNRDWHTYAALTFISHTKKWMRDYFGIPEW